MTATGGSRRPLRALANAVALATVAATVVVAAVRSDGFHAANVDLDDGAVWVTNQATGQVARLNIKLGELDFGRGGLTEPDVIQDGRIVFIGDDRGVVRQIVETGSAELPTNEMALDNYSMGGGTAAYLDPATGLVWTGTQGVPVAPQFPNGASTRVPAGSTVHVTANGRVLVVDRASASVFEVVLDERRSVISPPVEEDSDPPPSSAASDESSDDDPLDVAEYVPAETRDVGRPISPETQVASVGDDLYFVDPDGTIFGIGTDALAVAGEDPIVQQPGPSAAGVLVATSEGLFSVDPVAGEVVELSSSTGIPAAPVRVGDCVYGAWSGPTPTWFRSCPGQETVEGAPIEGGPSDERLLFRVNRRNVALNALRSGGVWAVNEGRLVVVGGWGDEFGQESDAEADDTDNAIEEEAERECLDRLTQAPPRASDDEVGLRSNGPTMFDVLGNDSDANCDPLFIVRADLADSAVGRLEVVDDGQHLLFLPSPEIRALGERDEPVVTAFSYAISDTADNVSDEASGTLLLSPVGSTNQPPRLRSTNDGEDVEMTAVVELGKSIRYNVLADWRDPDGDQLRLVSVTGETEGSLVEMSPDGTLLFGALSGTPGRVVLTVRVTDDQETNSDASAELTITVQPQGQAIKPVAQADFVSTLPGSPVDVRPLANDLDGNADPLVFTLGERSAEGTTALYDTQTETVTVTTSEAGTTTIPYSVSDGTETVESAIVVMTRPTPEQNQPPVPVPDRLVLRPGRNTNVDVLANDIEPDDDIMALVSATAPPVSDETGGVRVAVIDRSLLQVELVSPLDGRPPEGPFVVEYVVSDGRGADDVSHEIASRLTVLVDTSVFDQPPSPEPDAVVVRSGDVTSVDLLANDTDPDRDRVEMLGLREADVASLADDGGGVAWQRNGVLSVRGSRPGSYSLEYDVVANGRTSTGSVSVVVSPLPTDDTPNQPPAPTDLDMRAVRGKSVRFRVPLVAVDPDGDSVRLLSVSATDAAATGSSASIDPDQEGVIVYQAGRNEAVRADGFVYRVEDRFGLIGEARVDVVVIDSRESAPVAFDDELTVRPNRVVRVPVVMNDADADDDRLSLAELAFLDLDGRPTAEPVDPQAVSVDTDEWAGRETGGVLVVTAPGEGEPPVSQRYRVSDGANTAYAAVTVSSDPEAPNLVPVTYGEVVDPAAIEDRDSVTVDVWAMSYDPDGETSDLIVDLPPNSAQPEVEASSDGRSITIAVTSDPQTVVYQVRDQETSTGAGAFGVIRVPGSVNHRPVLSERGRDTSWVTLEADDPQPALFRVEELVSDPDGDTEIRLTDTEISANGTGTVVRVDDRSFTFAPNADNVSGYNAQVSFEVEDRPGQDDSLRASLSVSFSVLPAGNTPPTVTRDGALAVPVFNEPVTTDLADLVDDQQGDDLVFALAGSPPDFAIELDDSVVTVTSTSTERTVGDAVGSLRFTVTDGIDGHEPVEGAVALSISRSTIEPPRFIDTSSVIDVERDVEFRLPILGLLANRDDERVGGYTAAVGVVTGGGASAALCGQDLCFLATSVGRYSVPVTVTDGLDNTVTTQVNIAVSGLPTAPSSGVTGQVDDGSVAISWGAADNQGRQITRYVVDVFLAGERITSVTAEATGSQDAPTSATVAGLVNARSYQFEVWAVNEHGDGPRSPRSLEFMPDRLPDAPGNPRYEDYGDGTLRIAWDVPVGSYTPVESFRIDVDGRPPEFVPASQTSLDLTGLTNGQRYGFQVRAKNAARADNGDGTGWGPSSSPPAPLNNEDTPARAPDQPVVSDPVAAGDGGTPRATVTWSEPANGGRAITDYRVCIAGVPASCQSGPDVMDRQATFDLVAGERYRFTVEAINAVAPSKGNTSGPSAPSGEIQGVVTPGVPGGVSVSSGDRTLTVSASISSNGGCSSTFLEYSRTGGSTWQTSNVFSGLNNGTPYPIVVRATLGANCVSLVGSGAPSSAATAAVTQTPYGALGVPTISATVNGTSIVWTWNANQGANGRPWTATVSGEGCSWSVGPGGNQSDNCSRPVGYNSGTRTVTITVTAPGVASTSASASQSIGPPPAPSVSISYGTKTSGAVCWPNDAARDRGCYYVAVTVSGVSGSYTARCYGRTNQGGWAIYNGNGPFTIGNGRTEVCPFSAAGRVVIVAIDGTVSGTDVSPQISSGGTMSNQLGPWPVD